MNDREKWLVHSIRGIAGMGLAHDGAATDGLEIMLRIDAQRIASRLPSDSEIVGLIREYAPWRAVMLACDSVLSPPPPPPEPAPCDGCAGRDIETGLSRAQPGSAGLNRAIEYQTEKKENQNEAV